MMSSPSSYARVLVYVLVGTPTDSGSPRAWSGLRVGITPILVNSTNTFDFTMGHHPGNTVVRRKNIFGHSVITKATRASGDVIMVQMCDIATAGRDLERSKIEVQLKFIKQMEYQRERDWQLHDSVCATNNNIRLAIHKQDEVVKCLSNLSSVLSLRMNLSQKNVSTMEPQATPSDTNFMKASVPKD